MSQFTESSTNSVPTLQEICIQFIQSHPLRTLEGCLALYGRICDMDVIAFAPLRPILMRKIRDFYPVLQVKIKDPKELQAFFLPSDWEILQNDCKEREEAKYRMSYMKGSVVERDTPKVEREDLPFYPLEALVQGVAWPKNVDPANREQFLSDSDFFDVFHMTKEEFRATPKHIRIRLKKEKLLF